MTPPAPRSRRRFAADLSAIADGEATARAAQGRGVRRPSASRMSAATGSPTNPSASIVETLDHLMNTVSELASCTRNQLLESSAAGRRLRLQGAVAAAVECHRRAARRRDENAHAADRQRLAEAAADRARSRRPISARRSPSSRCTAPRPSSIRQVLELVKDPFTHLVRNCADHGIQTPAERLAAGKPEQSCIRLSACHQGGHIDDRDRRRRPRPRSAAHPRQKPSR